MIATCLHVIGEARPIHVRTAKGKKLQVLSVYSTDRKRDLAILKIKDGDLKPLPLGNSNTLTQGDPIIALGNPMGLTSSVVQGVLSARREMELGIMLQLAIPVEPGNSGGPILDRHGRIQGIMTMKSTVTANLGFAMPIDALKRLIDKPNPVSMNRWLTIGALNDQQWQPLMGAEWKQRAGRITVKGIGSGFGGRSLCLSRSTAPSMPYELEVMIKLDDESGAAGLVFGADGGQIHYGFYPTAGKLRLTRFDGPTVLNWSILKDLDTAHYKKGEWNTIKVRHEVGLIHCFVNGQEVFSFEDNNLGSGRIGLAKFRNTKAEFRKFRHGKILPTTFPPAKLLAKLDKMIALIKPKDEFSIDEIDSLKLNPALNQAILLKRAKSLETQAKQLRDLAETVQESSTQDELTKEMKQPEQDINLLRAALLIARLDNSEIEIEHYLNFVEDMAKSIHSELKPSASERAKLNAIGSYLFRQNGFHGSRGDYYNRSNSYLNEVIDDREGIPITLSVLYLEIAEHLDMHLQGLPLPGHFTVGRIDRDSNPLIIDVYNGGQIITRKEAEKLVLNTSGIRLLDKHLIPASKKDITLRMLRNLIGIGNSSDEPKTVIRYLNTLLKLEPNAPQERLNRALMHMKLKQNSKAKEDVRWLLDKNPPGFNRDRLLDLFQRL